MGSRTSDRIIIFHLTKVIIMLFLFSIIWEIWQRGKYILAQNVVSNSKFQSLVMKMTVT